jgi:hypothetical protein
MKVLAFRKGDGYITKPKETVDLIFENVNDDGSPCELICSAQIGIPSVVKFLLTKNYVVFPAICYKKREVNF